MIEKLLKDKKTELGLVELFELSDEEQDEAINNLSDKEKLVQSNKLVTYMQFCLDNITKEVNKQ